MTQKQERTGGTTKTTSYTYDSMNRLETVYEPDVNNAQRTVAYTYDSRGNRDTEVVTVTETNEVTYTEYDYTDSNRLQYVTTRESGQNGTIIQRKEYVYDNNGNLTDVYDVTNGQSTITTNTYTLLNQLESTETTGIDKLMENTYNAEGRRVAKTVDGATVRYFYEYGNVAFEYTNSGAVSAFNVIGTNLISRETGSDKVYYFYNGHGDVTALLDATTKNIRSQYRYDEFGNISSETYYDSNGEVTTDDDEIIKSQILYAGYQYDEESKYYNLHARYYDPQTARFLQQDTYTGTTADPLSLNLYTYCHNEPMMYFDPTGETPIRDLISKSKGSIGWDDKTKIATATVNGITYSFQVNSDKSINLIVGDVKYGTFKSEEAELIQYSSSGKLVAYIDIEDKTFNKYFNISQAVPQPEPNKDKRLNTIIKSGDEKLSEAAQDRITYLERMYGNLNNNAVPKAEADLIRNLDQKVIADSWRDKKLDWFYIRDINYAMETITAIESEIYKQSNLEGVPKSLIGSVLFREIMFLGIDDIVDGMGLEIKGKKVGETIGISQISARGVRDNELRVAGEETGRKQRFTDISDSEIQKMLLDPVASVYFAAMALKDRAYFEKIDIKSKNSNDIQKIFARYNDSGGVKGITVGPIKTKEVYGKETYEYYKEFEKYYGVIDGNRVIK